MSYVYLIRHATEPMFKIGKSDDPFWRSRAFEEKLDLDSSLQLHLGKRSSDFEKGLHALFDSYRLPPVSTGDGATEWFKIECWSRCIAFFDQNFDLIGSAPHSIPQLTPDRPYILTKAERAERRRNNKEIEQFEIYNKNLDFLCRWEQLPPWLAEQEIFDERVNEYGCLDIKLLGVTEERARAFDKSLIGRSGFNTENSWSTCGIETVSFCRNNSELTLSFRRLSADAMEQVRTVLAPELRGRFEAMDTWINERTNNAH